jgi:hypothetical protein
MMPSARPPVVFSALLVGAVLLAGCEVNTVESPPPPTQPLAISFTAPFLLADATVEGTIASVVLDAPEVTPAVVQTGVVLAYVREAGTWTALPFTYGVESPDLPAVDYTVSLGYAFETGFVEVFYDVSTPAALDFVTDRTVKVVVIQGNALTYSATHGGLDWRDYEAVRDHFGLDE